MKAVLEEFGLCNSGVSTILRRLYGFPAMCAMSDAFIAPSSHSSILFSFLIFLFNKELEVINQMKQRMRRISALLLVALMCVSCMVPAFAAEGEECPQIHTKTNCSYKQIGEPHEASCGQQGYTTYQCTECNTYFADDFVEAATAHAWQIVWQNPTCTTDGFEKAVCLNCGKEEIVDAEDDEGFKATGHGTPVFANGEDCVDGVICSVCGVELEMADDKHKWGKPELLKAPTHDKETSDPIDGTAKITCELCGESKTVTIISEEGHQWQIDMRKYASCTETGYALSAKCLLCGATGHPTMLSSCEWQACTIRGCDHNGAAGCAEVKCTKDGCKHATVKLHCAKAGCDHASCGDKNCKAAPYAATEALLTCEPSDQWIVEAPTCTAAGKAYRVCVMCGKIKTTPVTLNPLGHNYQTRIYKKVTTGGLTAAEIALFEGLANKAASGEYKYTFYVEGADGTLARVEGKATIPAKYYSTKDLETKFNELTYTEPSATTPSVDTADRYEWTGKFENADPTSKDPAGNTYMHWGANCSTETTSYRYACTVCGAEEEPVSFIGHYWGEPVYEAPKCGEEKNGTKVYTCKNPNCDGKGDVKDVKDEDDNVVVAYTNVTVGTNTTVAQKTEVVKWAHVYETEEYEVTCQKDGYKVDVCACGAIDLTKAAEGHGKNENDAKKDGWYDIVESTGDEHDTEIVWVTGYKVTCEKDGYYDLTCKTCGKVTDPMHKVDALGHEADLTQPIAGSETSADCLNPAYISYKCVHAEEYGCTKEIKVETAPLLGHSFTKEEPKKGDCTAQKPAYIAIYCSRCGVESDELAAPVPFDNENMDHHPTVVVEAVTPGDCTSLDTVMYKCTACEKTWIVKEDYVNAATGHTAGQGKHNGVKQAAHKATCEYAGNIEYYKCSACEKLFADKDCTKPITLDDTVIKALTEDGKHPADKIYDSEALAPTCTDKGHDAGQKCLLCDTVLDSVTEIDPLGHSFTVVLGEGEANCTEWGYKWVACANGCGSEQIINYVPSRGGHTPEKVKGYRPTCCATGLTDGEICSACEHEIVAQVEIAKLPHKNEKGEEFYGLCTDTVKAEDRICVYCLDGKYPYGKDDFEPIYGCYGGDHTKDDDTFVDGDCVEIPKDEEPGMGAHEWVVTRVEATCNSYSYTLVVCKHCGYDFITEKGITYSDEHIFWGEWEVKKPATTLEAGLKVRKCACGRGEESLPIPALAGLEIKVELENAVKPGADLPDNGKVNVIIKTNASDLDVWGIHFDLTYSSNLKFVGDVAKGAKFGTNVVRNVDPTKRTISIVATAPNVDGKVANVNLNGEEMLIILQFELVGAKKGETVSVSAGNLCNVNDKDQSKIKADIVLDDKAALEVKATRGEVVVDGELTIDDAKALMLYITGEAEKDYNSAADMDQDGEITIAGDFAAIINALLGTSGVLPNN